MFSAGADLREDHGVADPKTLRRGLLLRILLAMLECPKPVLPLLRGKAAGGGAMLALLADEVVMEQGANLAMPEFALGLPTPIGLSIIAVRSGRAGAHGLVQANPPMTAPAALAAKRLRWAAAVRSNGA